MTAADFYSDRKEHLEKERKQLLESKSLYAWLRLASIIIIGAATYMLAPLGWGVTLPVLIVLLVVFVRLVYRDLANKSAIGHNNTLRETTANELLALQGKYYHFKDGVEHAPKDHYYANDMDIFGHASLFQFLNRSVSEMGSAILAHWLLEPAPADDILARQQAVKELAKKNTWLQNLQAYGKENPVTINTKLRLQSWLHEAATHSNFTHWAWLRYLLPLFSVSITVATIFSYVSMNTFYLAMLFMATIAFSLEKKIGLLHNRLGKMVDELSTLSQSIGIIESESFATPLLQQLRHSYKPESKAASKKIHALRKILDRLDLRFNIVLAVPLNLLFLWNLQQALDLDKWRKDNNDEVGNWFDSLGILEALGSFATVLFNNSSWVFPAIHPDHFYIEASHLGHPLIPTAKRVNNFLKIDQQSEIMLVTGSNMAGKSTYLRSVGVNVVLAMAGAPVCASGFTVSPVQLLSSMRILDNLEESTSTFYAELKKLKTVIEKVNNHEHVFILLDEILRGTNSLDRHTGSEALIKQLIKKQAAAIIATHDVALASLEQNYPQNILNYHFDVQVNNEELFFDYKLKPGVCTSMNASILMKKIGIEM